MLSGIKDDVFGGTVLRGLAVLVRHSILVRKVLNGCSTIKSDVMCDA